MSVHQPDASEDEPAGGNILLGQGEPAGENNGPRNVSSVVQAILKGIVIGSYKSATYINAASFLREAVINETAKAKVNTKSGLTGYMKVPVKYSAKAIYWALGWQYDPPQSPPSRISAKEWLCSLPFAIVCATEAIIQCEAFIHGLEIDAIERYGAWIMILIRVVVHTVQMGAFGYLASPSSKGILIGVAVGFSIAYIRETITNHYKKYIMDKTINKELATEQQMLLWEYSQAAFLPYARKMLGIPYTVDNTGPVGMAPLAAMTLLMLLITDYKRMTEQRAAYIAQMAARIGLLGAVTGCGMGWKPRMSLIADAQGIAMWGVHSTMAYFND